MSEISPAQPIVSFLGEGRALEPHEQVVVSAPTTPEAVVISLAVTMELISERQVPVANHRIQTMANAYRNLYWHLEGLDRPVKDTDALEELYDQTESFEEVPFLMEAIKLRSLERNKNNETIFSAEHIVRLLVQQELLAQSSGEAQESA